MSTVDRWPSTPMKQITGWASFCALLVFSMLALWYEKVLNTEAFITVWAAVLGYNGIAFAQFWAKRSTAWEPPVEPTKSEVAQPPTEGQPAVPAAKTSAEAEGEE